MNLLVFLFAVGLGVLAAVPVGACQIEAAKRAMAGHLRPSLAVVAGSATSDGVYGAVALFGVAPVLEKPGVLAWFAAVGAVLLWFLAYRTWRESTRPHELDHGGSSLARKRWGLLTGFLLGMANPPIILSWLLGAALATRLGLSPVETMASKGYFVAGGVAGLAGYLAVMSIVTHRLRHFLSLRALARIYRALAVMLVGLSFYFVYAVLAYFTRAS